MTSASETGNCLTCKHNTYIALNVEWFDCCHPLTLERGPKWQPGDPAMVNLRTGDVPRSRISEISHCPTYEPAVPTA